MGQTLSFSTGSCGVGESIRLAALTCQPSFIPPGNSIKMVKYLEFTTYVNPSFDPRQPKHGESIHQNLKGAPLERITSEIHGTYSLALFVTVRLEAHAR